ncbi:MAG: hypothetical protein OEY97_07285 [Nitrospirota bacterium]|nr:hypothetical protein [Nitrospirota bacterium]
MTSVLLLFLPGVWLGALGVSLRLVTRRDVAVLISVSLGLSAWLLGIHVVSLALRSFYLGLWSATLALGCAGYVVWYRDLRRVPRNSHGGEAPTPLFGKWVWRGCLASTVIIAVLVGLGWGNDQQYVTGHLSVISQMNNGVYPPHFLQFPQFEYRYHYGVNTLCAALSAILHMPVDLTVDMVAVLAWAYLWLLLAAMGVAMFGGGVAAALLPVMVTCAGGTQPFLYLLQNAFHGSVIEALLVAVNVGKGGGGLVFHHFFQPPFMLGMVLMFSVLVITAFRRREERLYFPVAAVLFLALGISHIVVFLTVLACWFTWMTIEAWRSGQRESLPWIAGSFLGIVLLVSQMHGFFVPAYDPEAGVPLVPNRTAGDFALLATNLGMWMGLVFPALGVAGLLINRSWRVFWLLLLVGCCGVLLFLRYPHTWDIVKFAVVASIALGVGVAALLYRLLGSGYRWRVPLVGVLVVACVFSTASTVVASLVLRHYSGEPLKYYRMKTLGGEHLLAMEWLRKNVPDGQLILMEPELARRYSVWGGVGTPWDDIGELHGIPRQVIDRREALMRRLSMNPDDHLAEGIRWLLVTGERDRGLEAMGSRWVRAGRARQIALSERITVFEILPANPE